ncbi:MAG: plastocyanin/azurin family copper-binding protein [Candidatus Limnocylindrales bacterium]
MSRVVLAIAALAAVSLLAGCAGSASNPSFTFTPAASLAPVTSASTAPVPAASASAGASAPAPSAPEPSAPTPSASGPAANTIELKEWKVVMPTEVKAGMVTYTITNMGTVPHELIGFQSPLDPVAYPRTKDGDVNEEGKGIISTTDGPNLDPTGTETRTIDLTTPGRYVFMCNIPGHFERGMYAVVTVTP